MRDPTGPAREGSSAGTRQAGGQWQPQLSCRGYAPPAQDQGEGPWPIRNQAQPGRRGALGPAQRWAGQAHRVVVIGGGFAGLQVVRGLRKADAEVILVDRRNFHLFQPLLYQVATGSLSPGEIAQPLRGILARQRNAKVLLADVVAIDLPRRRVRLRRQPDGECSDLAYDSLIVAAGAAHSYFGHDSWAPYAPGLKTVEDALEIRQRILTAFEAAELETCPERRRAWLTFTVVGAGPTGVELAGQIAEIAQDTLRREFRAIDPAEAVILLVEANGRILPAYDRRLSAKAVVALRRLGVTPVLNARVVDINDRSIYMKPEGEEATEIATRTVIWAAGVSASPLAAVLAQAAGAGLDRAGRITVQPDLTLPGFPEVFAVGDMARISDGDGATLPIPGTASAAMQEGRHAARALRRRLVGRAAKPFAYRDQGSLATIGRKAAVAQIHQVRLSGFPAWLAWAIIHLHFLMGGLQNQFIVLVRWTVSFITRGRSSRLITAPGLPPRPAATRAEPAMVVRRPVGWVGAGGGADRGSGGRAERLASCWTGPRRPPRWKDYWQRCGTG
jgi:NADH:ubiquinone reductase (H+-translocating)